MLRFAGVIVGLVAVGVAGLWFFHDLYYPVVPNSGAGPSWNGVVQVIVALLGLFVIGIGWIVGVLIGEERETPPQADTWDASKRRRSGSW